MAMNPEELARFANRMQEIARQVQLPTEIVADMGRHINHLTRVPAHELSRSVAASRKILDEMAAKSRLAILQSVQDTALRIRIPEEVLRTQREALEAFTKGLPRVTLAYPEMATGFQFRSPELDRIRHLFQTLGSLSVPTVPIDSRVLQGLRDSAWEAAHEGSVESPDLEEALTEVVQTIEDVEQSVTKRRAGENARSRALLILMIVGVLFQFLSNQDAILRNAFEDAALLSNTLARVWPYAAAVLIVLFLGTKIRPPRD